MPELPEVETIRRDLLPLVQGRTINKVHITRNTPKLIQSPQKIGDFRKGLLKNRIVDVRRRGKYLLLDLSDGRTWIVHFRMTGALLYRQSGGKGARFLRASFRLDNNSWLDYIDLRKLGMMWLVKNAESVIGKLGPEPLSNKFSPKDLGAALSKRKASVKSVLLDQAVVAGIGNIYADEALFLATINPQRPSQSLGATEVRKLHSSIRCVLMEALGDGGSSFSDYVHINGDIGQHQLHVRVFRRTNKPCLNCKTLIKRLKVNGRSTHFCPNCQK